jgi:hypothetical protein
VAGRRNPMRYRDKTQRIYAAIEAENAREVKPVLDRAQAIVLEQHPNESSEGGRSKGN